MYKVLQGSAELGGTLALQKDLIARAAQDLEDKLNVEGIEKVISAGSYESASEVVLFAIVEVSQPKLKVKKHTGKGE